VKVYEFFFRRALIRMIVVSAVSLLVWWAIR
jgi:hypothetical protein